MFEIKIYLFWGYKPHRVPLISNTMTCEKDYIVFKILDSLDSESKDLIKENTRCELFMRYIVKVVTDVSMDNRKVKYCLYIC
jgi:hypothetical protein